MTFYSYFTKVRGRVRNNHSYILFPYFYIFRQSFVDIILQKGRDKCRMKNKISSKKQNKYVKEDNAMIIMNLQIDNFCAFKNFHMNMAYPKKIVNSYIPNEYLKGRDNFRYKKVNILMGGNATGKTSIGKILMEICYFIKQKEAFSLVKKIADVNKEASISMDFICKSFIMYRVDVKVIPGKDEMEEPIILACKRETTIEEKDRYETCAKKIDDIPIVYSDNYKKELDGIESIGWMFTYPSDMSDNKVRFREDETYLKVLDYTLRSLDPSIMGVDQSSEVENTYIIHLNSRDLLVQDGEVIRKSILSSGTKAGIDIASLIFAIYKGECGFYYCDEKFSYIHSELEKAFLTIMIYGLRENEQLFFTTHNSDILDLPLPKHAFTFLKKEIFENEQLIKCVYVSDYLKRSTDSVRRAVDNDLFSASPNIELVYKIAEIEEFVKEED